MTETTKYTVTGSRKDGYAVLENGGILYDLLETRQEALAIAELCRAGIVEWDDVYPALQKAGIEL